MRRVYFFFVFMSMFACLQAQVSPGVYFASADGAEYELKMTDNYVVLTTYKSNPAEFLQTIGGFYEVEDGILEIDLEFNSDFEKDSIDEIDIPFRAKDDILILEIGSDLVFQKAEDSEQDLDGNWLFATRGPDSGQERRGDENARKTLKFLKDGTFQWIAYNTETMEFFGTGGGSYTASDGEYIEQIEFFSRDNSRVGAKLKFEYNLIDDDWHHTGLNSKGEPLYEIWAKR